MYIVSCDCLHLFKDLRLCATLNASGLCFITMASGQTQNSFTMLLECREGTLELQILGVNDRITMFVVNDKTEKVV